MQSIATLIDVQEQPDGSIFVVLPDGFGKSYIDRATLEADVNSRLQSATESMIWLLINQWLIDGTTSGQCVLDTDEPSGNWVKRL